VSGRRRPRKILAIDWDARTLRVVHAIVGKRGVKIDRVFNASIPSSVDVDDPQQMGDHIRRSLDQEEISTRYAVVDIPRDQVTLNTLTLPAGMPDELPGIVEIQIAKQLPFAVGAAAIDFVAGEREGDSPTISVQVAAVRREVLGQYLATFAAAGVRLEKGGLRPYANKVSVCEVLKHAMPERVMFIDVRPAFTEIDVLKNGALAFSRAASVMVPEGSGAPPSLSLARDRTSPDDAERSPTPAKLAPRSDVAGVVNMLVVEVTRSIEAYRETEPGANIDHAVIGGDLGIEEALAEAIQSRLDITTEIYNPASTFGWEPDEGAAASAFAATLGLVLVSADDTCVQFDFLHPKQTVSVTKQRLKKAPLVAAVAVLFLAAGAVVLAEITKQDRQTLVQLEEKIGKLEGRSAENDKFLKLVEEIQSFGDRQLVWVDVLYDALSVFPSHEEFILTHADLNQKERRLVFKTKCKSRETATEVVESLNTLRRAGADKPRFRATMGPQSEKAKDLYPFSQILKIDVLDDGLEG